MTNGTPDPSLRSTVDFPVERIRRDFPALHNNSGDRPLIWLDNAATTHKPSQVIESVAEFYARYNSNVHRGAHALARRATEEYEAARSAVAAFLGARRPEEIVFVRGTTEAINLVAGSWGRSALHQGDEIIVTELEHHSNIVAWQLLAEQKGLRLRVVPLDDSGALDMEVYCDLLGHQTKLVAVSHSSNVLGTVPPIKDITRLAHRYGALVLVDGAQAVGHFPVDVREIDADFYAVSGHKFFGPTGIGALYGKSDLLRTMPPWQGGGGMIDHVSFEHTTYAPPPGRFEAGTGHIAGAIGLRSAIEYLTEVGTASLARYESRLAAYTAAKLAAVPGLRSLGTVPGKIGVFTFVSSHSSPNELARALDDQGIAVRAGHHCAQPALRRYGATNAVRLSLALYNTFDEIDTLAHSLQVLSSSVYRPTP